MKCLHVSLTVHDLSESVQFYSALFGEDPSVLKEDYAKWDLEDPAVNFAISPTDGAPSLNHLGIQAETHAELAVVRARIAKADAPAEDQDDAACCYAKSDKTWTVDPQGFVWEAFHTTDTHETFGEDRLDAVSLSREPREEPGETVSGCCEPSGSASGCCS